MEVLCLGPLLAPNDARWRKLPCRLLLFPFFSGVRGLRGLLKVGDDCALLVDVGGDRHI
jgi:hypothetical protein